MAAPVRVLYVGEDSTLAADVTEAVSRREGWQLVTAIRATGARERIADGRVDCVVCDRESTVERQRGLSLLERERSDDVPMLLLADGETPDAVDSGVVTVDRRDTTAEQLVERIARAVDDAARRRRVRLDADRYRGIVDVSRAVRSSELKPALDAAASVAVDALDADCGQIFERRPDGTTLTFRAGSGIPGEVIDATTVTAGAGTLLGQALRSGETTVVTDLRSDARFHGVGVPIGRSVRSGIATPIGDPARPWGVLAAADSARRSFTKRDVQFVQIVATVLTAVVGTVDEVELLERNRELERQNEHLQRFTDVVAHDIRSPLNVARGRLALLEGSDQETVDAVVDALDRIDELVEDLLTLARRDHSTDDLETVDVSQLAAESWAGVDTADATPVIDAEMTVTASPSRLRELFENLFCNAVEHGGEDVTVRVGPLDDGFYVEDDGPGVPPDDRTRVFASGVTTVDGGTGLGLAIVSTIAAAHGWSVEMTDGHDGGARVEMTGVDVH